MMHRSTVLLLLVLLPILGAAQLYKSTFGLRFDDAQLGLSAAYRFQQRLSAEAFVDLDRDEFRAGSNLRFHNKLAGRRLNWYPIGGLFLASRKNVGDTWGFTPGIGAEYKFILAPVVISFDFAPHIYLTRDFPDYWSPQTVFSIKYILVKDKRITLPKRRERDPD